jgi:predicted metalloenzyme YecM
MLNPNNLPEQIEYYLHDLKMAFYAHGLVRLLEGKQIDHFAIKAIDTKEFEEYLKTYLPLCRRLSYTELNERRLATGELYEAIQFAEYGVCSTIELMEPRPGSITATYDRLDHIELRVDDLEEIKELLSQRQMECELQDNGVHQAVVVVINERGQEVKFTNKSLLGIVSEQIATGISKVINEQTQAATAG